MRGVLERRVRALRGGRGGGEGIGRCGEEKGEEKGEVERGRSMPEEEGRGCGAPLSLCDGATREEGTGTGTGSGEELWAPATAGDGGAPRVR